jgi:ATP-dependent RNA helicase RhlE
MTGDAFTFVAPEEATDLAQIERAIGRRLPRITVPGFDYAKAPAERFEVPIGERIAAIRARKAEERKRAQEKAQRRAAHHAAEETRRREKAERAARSSRPAGPSRPAGMVGPSRPAATAGPSHRPAPPSAHRPSSRPAGPPATVTPRWGRRG